MILTWNLFKHLIRNTTNLFRTQTAVIKIDQHNFALKSSQRTSSIQESNLNPISSMKEKKHKRNISEESVNHQGKQEDDSDNKNEKCAKFIKDSLAKYKSEKELEITSELFVNYLLIT